MVTGAGNDMPTAMMALEFLQPNESMDEVNNFMYESLGEGSDMVNQAKVFSGLYREGTDASREGIPYILGMKLHLLVSGQSGESRGKRWSSWKSWKTR